MTSNEQAARILGEAMAKASEMLGDEYPVAQQGILAYIKSKELYMDGEVMTVDGMMFVADYLRFRCQVMP